MLDSISVKIRILFSNVRTKDATWHYLNLFTIYFLVITLLSGSGRQNIRWPWWWMPNCGQLRQWGRLSGETQVLGVIAAQEQGDLVNEMMRWLELNESAWNFTSRTLIWKQFLFLLMWNWEFRPPNVKSMIHSSTWYTFSGCWSMMVSCQRYCIPKFMSLMFSVTF